MTDAHHPDHPDDDALLGELRSLATRTDPVPDHVAELARAAFDWRTLDAELARLVMDSADRELAGELVRSAGMVRLLTFETGEVTIEIEVERASDGTLTLTGLLLPQQAARLELHHATGELPVEAGADGRFGAYGLSPGPFRLSCLPHGGRRIETEWTSL